MYLLKDKVTEKLSHLFVDSQPSGSHMHEARSNAQGRKSSFFSYFLPSASIDGLNPRNHANDIQSGPVEWTSKNFDWQSIPSDGGAEPGLGCDKKETPCACEEFEDLPSARSINDSNLFKEVVGPQPLEKPMACLTEDSSFISSKLYEFLLSSLPNIVKGCQWVLLYSTLKHGISLRTLIRKSAGLSGPCLLVTGDRQGSVFGGLLECPLKPTAKRKYQGTNQTFVFTTIHGEPRLFRPTGANRYYYLCLNELLALGGGGSFALCFDGDLLNGSSGPCETFGNSCLAHSREFELKNVELWGFVHSSRYLT